MAAKSTKVYWGIGLLTFAVGGVWYFNSMQPQPVPVAAPEPPTLEAPVVEVEVPAEPPVVPVPKPEPVVVEVEPEIPDRFGYHTLTSKDGRSIEAQILDVVDATAYVRREDQVVFEIPLSGFDAPTSQIVAAWQTAYAALVTPEQKAFLQKPVEPEVATSAPVPPVTPTRDRSEPQGPFLEDRIDGVTWELVDEMSDEFEGRRIDDDKWQTEPKGNGWNWIGRPPGLFLAENVRVEDGAMKVTVSILKKPREVNGHEFLYQGAIVRSIEAGQPGWFYECRMKANATEMSSTFWLMTKGQTIKKLELDIQECVGVVSPDAADWVGKWDQIFHSNMIHRENAHNPEKLQIQGQKILDDKNHERYFVYGAWWKSEREVQFFIDGEYAYTITPEIDWDVPAYLQMAIEVYDWNPVPERNSEVERASEEERTTSYDWIRTWRVVSED